MKQFEYKSVKQSKSATVSSLERMLNAMGEEGWELVMFDYGQWFFKREVSEEVLAEKEAKAQAKIAMFAHLRDAHDVLVYIGDVFAEHRTSFPDCTYHVEV